MLALTMVLESVDNACWKSLVYFEVLGTIKGSAV